MFGEVRNGKMVRNDAGEMLMKSYADLEQHFPDVACLDACVMPNHFHCILHMRDDATRLGVALVETDSTGSTSSVGTYPRVCPKNVYVPTG